MWRTTLAYPRRYTIQASCIANDDIETLIVEINFKKRRWFLNGSYNRIILNV